MSVAPLLVIYGVSSASPARVVTTPEATLYPSVARICLDPSGILDIKHVLVIWLGDNGIEGECSRLQGLRQSLVLLIRNGTQLVDSRSKEGASIPVYISKTHFANGITFWTRSSYGRSVRNNTALPRTESQAIRGFAWNQPLSKTVELTWKNPLSERKRESGMSSNEWFTRPQYYASCSTVFERGRFHANPRIAEILKVLS